MDVANDLDRRGELDEGRLAKKDVAGGETDGGDFVVLETEGLADLAGVTHVEKTLDHVVYIELLEPLP